MRSVSIVSIRPGPLLAISVAVLLVLGGAPQDTRAQQNSETAPRLAYKNENESELLITLAATDELAIWDTQNDELTRLISLTDPSGTTCREPRSVVYTDPGFIWVACFASNEVWVMEESTEEVVAQVDSLEAPWELDHSANEDWVVVSSWGGELGPWEPDQPGSRSGTVTLIEADSADGDFGSRVPESELPGEAPNPIEIPSTGDGGPWGAAACEGIFFITQDGTDTTYKLTIDPFALEIFDKGELPWEVECRGGPPMRIVVGNGGDDTPPDGFTETVTVDGPTRDRNGNPVQTSYASFPNRENPNACWNTVYDSWSSHQQDKYSNHAQLPWYNTDSPSSGAADYSRARSGAASFTIITVFENGECEYKHVPVGENLPPDAVEPWAADIGPNSNVYLVDMHENLTREYDVSTDSITNFESQNYTAPRDVAVMNGKLYVANTGEHTISSQDAGKPVDYDYSKTDSSGLEVFDLETGEHLLSDPLTTVATSSPDRATSIPDTYHLAQNYPNPFNPVTTISFAVPERTRVRITLFNLLGQEVATLVNGRRAPGHHAVRWSGHGHPSGTYIYRMEAGGELIQTRTLTLIK